MTGLGGLLLIALSVDNEVRLNGGYYCMDSITDVQAAIGLYRIPFLFSSICSNAITH